MKIVAISDTHSHHRSIKNAACGDVLVHAGDMTMDGRLDKVFDVAEWFAWLLSQGFYKNVVVIPGNHDVTAQSDWPRFSEYFNRPGIHLLNESGMTIDGVKFYGTPWTPAFGQGWAFQLPRDGYEATLHWDSIPADTDVLVSHGPPYKVCDKVPDYTQPYRAVTQGGRRTYNNYVDAGDQTLRTMLEKSKIKLHICGHLHHGYGEGLCDNGITRVVNASTCTEQYKPMNPPVVIDL